MTIDDGFVETIDRAARSGRTHTMGAGGLVSIENTDRSKVFAAFSGGCGGPA